MVGYKLLNEDLTNQYGYKYELNKKYDLDSIISDNNFNGVAKLISLTN